MDTLSQFWNQGRSDLMILLTLIGSALSAVPAGILLACRLKSTAGMRVLLSLIFIPVFYGVSFCLCFFACAGVGNR